MLVREIMKKQVICATEDASLRDVARKMMEQNIGVIPVVDDRQQLRGILTDRDIAMAVAAEGRSPERTRVGEVMAHEAVCTEIDADLESALKTMNQTRARRLPVIEQGRVVGILSVTDLAGAMREQFDQFIGIEEIHRH